MVNDVLRVGVIQTSLDATTAWVEDETSNWQNSVRMSITEERRARKEIRHFMAALDGLNHRPDIVLLPELSVPIGYESHLKRVADKMECIVIAGLDYQIEKSENRPTVSNEAVVIVPRKLNGAQLSRRTELRRVGKTYAAAREEQKLNKIGVEFLPRPTVWLFESDLLGKFAVAVCYDFVDLDRIVLYRNRIQTLFILSYNKDTTSFEHIAEAVARTVFCNVVVCNCGHFGGSLAVSPFRKPYKRAVYRHSGQNLPNAQLVELPLSDLIAHQTKVDTTTGDFKSTPPGYSNLIPLTTRSEPI